MKVTVGPKWQWIYLAKMLVCILGMVLTVLLAILIPSTFIPAAVIFAATWHIWYLFNSDLPDKPDESSTDTPHGLAKYMRTAILATERSKLRWAALCGYLVLLYAIIDHFFVR